MTPSHATAHTRRPDLSVTAVAVHNRKLGELVLAAVTEGGKPQAAAAAGEGAGDVSAEVAHNGAQHNFVQQLSRHTILI